MAVTAINLARVSNNLRAINLLEALRFNQAGLFRVENSLATGLRFQQASEDPLRAAAVATIDRRRNLIDQVQSNLSRANDVLTETDTAMQEALDLLNEAEALAVQAVGDTITPDERHSLATIVGSLVDQLVTIGNRQFLNTYLFGGRLNAAPFERTATGITYQGDQGRLETMVDVDRSTDTFTVPGTEFFCAVSRGLRGAVDLDPAVSKETRISDLEGAVGRGVELGFVRVTVGGVWSDIDLRGAATVGDVVDKLNAGAPTGIQFGLGTYGLTILRDASATGEVTIGDIGGGRTAADLGLVGTVSEAAREGAGLSPRITLLTPIAQLLGGRGLDLRGGLIIQNGAQTATVNLDDAVTVEDVLNRINETGIGAWARIADDGQRIEVLNRVSGTVLQFSNGSGAIVAALGLQPMHAGTALADLNDGAGVQTVSGNDLRITTASGTQLDISLSGAVTLSDVIDRLNSASETGAISAALAADGTGLVITDNTGGAGVLQIEPLNNSRALYDLGLDTPVSGNQIIGRNVNLVRADSPFTALLELQEGMTTDDRALLTRAGDRLRRVLGQMRAVQGQMASQARMMSERSERVETEATATEVMLSDVRDVDFTEAAVRFQQLQMALQANLTTAMRVMNLSVLDYLK